MLFPQSTEFGKRIPKQKFYENMEVSPAIKKLFADQIKLIYWRNKLAASTLNIADGETVDEVEVFELRLNEPRIDEDIIKQIDKVIPYKILYILTFDGRAQAWIGYRNSEVNRYFHTDWMPEDELELSVDGLSMDAVYENLVRQIAGIQGEAWSDECEVAENVARDEKKKQLEKQIAALESRMRKERQLNRQMEMNAELKILRRELEKI